MIKLPTLVWKEQLFRWISPPTDDRRKKKIERRIVSTDGDSVSSLTSSQLIILKQETLKSRAGTSPQFFGFEHHRALGFELGSGSSLRYWDFRAQHSLSLLYYVENQFCSSLIELLRKLSPGSSLFIASFSSGPGLRAGSGTRSSSSQVTECKIASDSSRSSTLEQAVIKDDLKKFRSTKWTSLVGWDTGNFLSR